MIRTWLNDLYMAARRLYARPWFSLLVTVVLGTGLASVITTGALVDGFLLRPAPFPDAHRLHTVGWNDPVNAGQMQPIFSAEVLALEQSPAVAQLGAWYTGSANLNTGSQAQRLSGTFVHGPLLDMLGAKPSMGTLFSAADLQAGAPARVLLGDAVWRNQFGADPQIVGRAIRINGEAVTVAGVMPAGFSFPFQEQLWLTRPALAPATPEAFRQFRWRVVTTLVDNASAQQLLEVVSGILERSRVEHRLEQRQALVGNLIQMFVDDTTASVLWLLFGAGALTLLIASSNVTTLLLARSSNRTSEFQLRAALGAGRAALLRDVLAEALLLAGAALLLALPLASAALGWMQQRLLDVDDGAAYWVSYAIDGRLVLAAALFALGSAAFSGLLPALRGSRAALTELRGSGKGMLSSSGRLMGALVVFEVALCLTLLTGGTVLQRHLHDLISKPLGAQVDGVLTARVSLFPSRHPDAQARRDYMQQLRAALQADPNLHQSALTEGLPGITSNWTHASLNLPADGEEAGVAIYQSAVDPEFFDVLQIKLESGRLLDASDQADSERVAVIDRRLASQLYPDGTALGQRLRLAQDPTGTWRTVVGVVAPVHMDDLDDVERPAVFTPLIQRPVSSFHVVIRPQHMDLTKAAVALERLVAGLDGDTPAFMVAPLSTRIEGGRFGPTIMSELFGAIAVLALLLAATGLYGVLAYATQRRTREFGLKRALGASRLALIVTALRGGTWQFVIGALIGLPLALQIAQTLSAVVGAAQGMDTVAIGMAALVLLAACLLAAGVPAWRAMRCDPLTALRAD